MIVCTACGAENPDRASFCMSCGARLPQAIVRLEERKVVTVLFCDLVGFTAMSEAADPEDVDRLLGEYSAHARRAIESHGGTVEKFIGDAVVGVFGVPVVHEDDPERAVRAALRLLDVLRAADLRSPGGAPLQARCGVNTGEALVRLDVDPLSGRGFVAGDVVNTAARLQAAAPPMGVAVGGLTHELSVEAVDYVDLPPVVAKGKAAPVATWLARRPLARTGLRTTTLTATPFLGREQELDALEEALRLASREGKSQFVLVVGEPGVGKSRLVLEFARAVDCRPEMTTWRQGRCLPYGEGVTYWALGEIVKQHLGIFESDDVAGVEAKLEGAVLQDEEGAWLRQHLRPLLGLDGPRTSREENFAAWSRFLARIAARRPTVLVLEDLHWAGEAMLDFVDHLLCGVVEAQLLIVATARPELLRQHDGALTAGGARLRRLALAPLSQRASEKLVEGLAGAGLAPSDRRLIVEQAAGNPLYAEQYVRLLLDSDRLVRSAGGLRLTDEALPPPTTVKAVLAARLDTLPPYQKSLLCDAAVIGETFWRGALVALSGRDSAEVSDVMAALAARDLVRPAVSASIGGETEYLFWHALARDVAYAQLPRGVRARKHQAAAEWVALTTGERSAEFSEILAHHYGTALELARAVGDDAFAAALIAPALGSLSLAGERALRLDPAAAERHLAQALELAGSDGAERPRLLTRLAEALFLRNRLREAAGLLEEAIARHRAAGDKRAAAVAMCRLAHTLPRLGESDRGLTRDAVALLEGDDPSPEQAEVLAMHALSVAIEGTDLYQVLYAATRAMEICDLLGLPEPALAMHCRADARLTLGDREGMADYDRAVAAARAQGLGRERATIEGNRTNLVFALEGPRAARRATLEAMEFDRMHGLEAYVLDCRVGLVAFLRDAGEWDRALGEAADLLALVEDSDDVSDTLYVRSLLAQLLAERGDGAQARPTLPWLMDKSRESVGYLRGAALFGAALVSARAGETATTVALLAEWVASPEAVTSNVEVVPAAVRAALGCGEEGIATGFLQCCLTGFPEPRLPLVENVVGSVEALLAEAGADHETAAAGFADAAARWREFEMPYEQAHACLGLGRSLVALGRKPEAAEPLVAAAAIFLRLGARPALEETEDLRASLA